ncbi:winged helix family transcriptional regulator [Vibrio ponticus]|uniref:Winged helix family transcriptional regulator n=1 Tax=Vibrio ponticus TaxID=265668 RepID=A0A3N3DTA6_9VIBR|nr:helix-turn-helix domain-containing protein [Vibrio ponticus]ROV57662.1 winged helix family transcriptional regulator [Vibrio ponticus]
MTSQGNTIILGDLIWEVESKELKKVVGDTVNEVAVVLTPKQYQLLKCLYDAHPNVLTKEQIVDEVWSNTFTSSESLPQLIIRTRQAIGDSTKQILVNQTGIGYSLNFKLPVDDKVDSALSEHDSAKIPNSKQAFGLWQFLVILMCLGTAYHAFEVGKSFYYASVFKRVHHTNPYPNVLSISDGKVDVLIGKTKCVYEKKKLLLDCE